MAAHSQGFFATAFVDLLKHEYVSECTVGCVRAWAWMDGRRMNALIG